MKFFTCHLAKTTLSFLRLKGKIVTMVNFFVKVPNSVNAKEEK